MVRRFERDDLGYVAWLAAHVDGYVLNTHIHATSDYVILHRARCRTVNRPLAADRSWTYAYGKTCSDAREDLEAWALGEAGGPAQPCGKCLASPGRPVAAESGQVPAAGSIESRRAPRPLLETAAMDGEGISVRIRGTLLRRQDDEPWAIPASRRVPPRAAAPDRAIETDADVIILGCVSGKRPGPLPAKDLYDSDLFDRRRRYAEATGKPWVIFSAKHGILDPDDEIEWYDVALKELPHRVRRDKGEEAVRQLEERFGPLAGMTFEIHAGEAYRTAIEGPLSARGARLLNPVANLRIGQLKQWYGRQLGGPEPGPEAPPLARSVYAQGASTLGAIAIAEVTEIAGFSWRWPMGTEEFDHGWDYVASTDGDRYRVRHGIGGRVVYGQYRVHSVTWLDKSPMVEGVAPDDYGTSGALISVIRIGGGPHVRSLGELPLGYAGFEIVCQSDEINAKYAHASLSVKILEDDLAGWARHAILRARSKGSPKHVAGSQQRTAPPAAPLSEPPDLDRLAITRVLLDYGRAAVAHQASQGPAEFTPNPEANRLIREDPFAFLLAVIFDQGILAERAWAAPYELRRRLGHLDLARIAADPTAVAEAVARPPMLQRFVNTVPGWVVAAADKVLTEYGGDAGRIWGDEPSASELERRLDVFQGIGQKKAAMAVEILERDLGVTIRSLHGTNIAYDVHVRRIFLRTGLAARDDLDEMVAAARALHPERPGEMDFPMWLIGRQWCRPGVPLCTECPLFTVCPRLVDRADDVRGA